jgi:uncharacterized membrane protein YphA (DoxX/SURF4 family)
MTKRIVLLGIRVLTAASLLYAAIFFKFAGVAYSVALFTKMSGAFHGLILQPVFRIGCGIVETVLAILFLIPKTARLGAALIVVYMLGPILSHVFVLGYDSVFVDALVTFALPCLYLLLAPRQSHREPQTA